MLTYQEVIDRLAGADSFTSAVNAIKAQFEGTRGGASKHIAETYGVSRRTAQRWLTGKGPATRTSAGRATRAQVVEDTKARRAAQRLRQAGAIRVGKIEVEYHGRPEGERFIPGDVIELDGGIRAMFNEAADAIEADPDSEEARDALSDATVYGYVSAAGDDPDGNPPPVDVVGWDSFDIL